MAAFFFQHGHFFCFGPQNLTMKQLEDLETSYADDILTSMGRSRSRIISSLHGEASQAEPGANHCGWLSNRPLDRKWFCGQLVAVLGNYCPLYNVYSFSSHLGGVLVVRAFVPWLQVQRNSLLPQIPSPRKSSGVVTEYMGKTIRKKRKHTAYNTAYNQEYNQREVGCESWVQS